MSRRPLSALSLGGRLSSVVWMLIAWNAIVFLLLAVSARFVEGLDRLILLNLGLIPPDLLRGRVWELFTYMFLHRELGHFFFNMLALWMFGGPLEARWGSRPFLIYYIFTGVGGGITNAAVELLRHPQVPSLIYGASGAIFGLLVAFALEFPRSTILFLFFPLQARYAVLLYALLEYYFSLTGGRSGVAHLAHLGGALFGWLYLKVIPWDKLRRRRRRRYDGVYDIRDHM